MGGQRGQDYARLPDSAHPRHCFPGIGRSLAHRVGRMCSGEEGRKYSSLDSYAGDGGYMFTEVFMGM